MNDIDPRAKTRVTEAKPDPFVGRTIDGLKIESILGSGGMGTVYKATQLSLGRPVAVKVLTAELADDKQFLDRFERECDALSRLSHPNIVAVVDRGDVDGRPYLVMEYVDGASLRDVIAGGPLPSGEALRIVSSVLEALAHAHAEGIVHRDIKPENVLLARGTIVKVADFGLSRLLGPDERTRLTRTNLMLGTFEYMAPEQREKAREADERSDLYATGVVLYELLTGELPIGRFELPSRLRPGECDRRIDAVVAKSLEKDPARRYQEADEMAKAVSAILQHAAPESAPRAPRRPSPPPPRAGRFENHLAIIRVLQMSIAVVFYVVGGLATLGAGFIGLAGMDEILAVVAVAAVGAGILGIGWIFHANARGLKRHTEGARTMLTVLAVLAVGLGFLPLGIYYLIILFASRHRAYYDARNRGLSLEEAEAHAEGTRSAPLPPVTTPTAEAAARARVPTPSEIPVESVVTSRVVESSPAKPAKRQVSGFVVAGLVLAGLGTMAILAAITGGTSFPMEISLLPVALAVAVLVIGFFHSLISGKRGALAAAIAGAVLLFVTVLGAFQPGAPGGRVAAYSPPRPMSASVRLGRFARSQRSATIKAAGVLRDDMRMDWVRRMAAVERDVTAKLWLSVIQGDIYLNVPRHLFSDTGQLQRLAYAVTRVLDANEPSKFNFTLFPDPQFRAAVEANPPP